MPANNTAGMTAAMKAYKTQVAKNKSQYASSDRMNAMAKAAGKPVAKKVRRSMPVSPLKKAAAKSARPKSYRASSR